MKKTLKSLVFITLIALILTAFTGCELVDKFKALFHEHNYILTQGQKPTCTEKGFTRGEHCTECDSVLIPVEELAALGHAWVDATCTTAKTCSTCNTTEGEALGHSESEWIVDKAATAAEDGKQHTECTACKTVFKEETLHALGSEGLVYELLEDGTYSVVGIGECTDTDIVIPAYHEGIAVTSIFEEAFYQNSTIKSVYILDGITVIGEMAFEGCSVLESIRLPETLTDLGRRALAISAITSITIPESIVNVGDGLLFRCTSLEEVTLPSTIKEISGGMFEQCSSLKSIVLPASVESIGDYAFSSCTALEEITISEGVRTIGSYAFQNCKALKSITLPNSVTTVGESLFNNCSSLTHVVLSDNITVITLRMFRYCTLLETVIFPKELETIDKWAFSGCSSLKEAVLPDKLKSINWCAFSDCSSLSKVVLPESLTLLDEGAFNDCTSLKEIAIPGGVTSLVRTFNGCTSLKKVTLSEGLLSLDGMVFYGTVISELVIPTTVTSIGQYVFMRASNITSLTYAGTMEQWNAISLHADWYYLSSITEVVCTDGVITLD